MAYTVKNFRTKKELKEAVTQLNEIRKTDPADRYNRLTVGAVLDSTKPQPSLNRLERDLGLQTLMFPEPQNGEVTIEGPQFPEPHKWYARVQVKDGVVVKVLS